MFPLSVQIGIKFSATCLGRFPRSNTFPKLLGQSRFISSRDGCSLLSLNVQENYLQSNNLADLDFSVISKYETDIEYKFQLHKKMFKPI